ncbi:MAG: hypothetical protein RSF40_01315 [Oscillospiraceae bacterium]
MNDYKTYDEITKEVLDTVSVGDLIKVNDWKKPMRVVGVSENYFVMIEKLFGRTFYSVCEKITLPDGYLHNDMQGGKFHCSTDNMIFGYVPKDFDMENGKQYDFDNEDWVKEYLQAFENKEIELSVRTGVAIKTIEIKKEF